MNFLQKNYQRLKIDFFRLVSCFFGNSHIGVFLRFHFLKLLGVSFEGRCRIFSGIYFLEINNNLFFGKNVFVNVNSHFDLTDRVSIGNNALIGPNVTFLTSTHEASKTYEIRKKVKSMGPILLEDNVFIGANSTILGGITIGENSIIGACSLVNKSIPPNNIAFGNPVKLYKPL